MKIRRNALCFCGSGKRYRKCHGSLDYVRDITAALKRHEAGELIRRQQQGDGKAIVSADFAGHKLVAVRNKLLYSKNWKTFPDFLFDYLVMTLGTEWFSGERRKSAESRHIIIDWVEATNEQRKTGVKTSDGLVQTPVDGLSACILGLAYGLYLLDHNVELQARLAHRLKTIEAFQGAYYEVTVASVLIRAGFDLFLENENDRNNRHCEFSAVRRSSGKRYWIECKARSVTGILGKTDANGCQISEHSTSKLIKHLTGALAKPAKDKKLIFIDLNAPAELSTTREEIRNLNARVASMIERYCRNVNPSDEAYVFVTNLPFHRYLRELPRIMVLPFGINQPDFNVPGQYTLREMYKKEMLHADAFDIATSFSQLTNVPTPFDGSLISEREGSSRILIGETYDFLDAVPGRIATVTSASVDEHGKSILISVLAADGRSYIIRKPMTDEELSDNRSHADAFFGEVRPLSRVKVDSAYDLFKWLLAAYKDTTREKFLEWLPETIPNVGRSSDLDIQELREIHCGYTAIAVAQQGKARPT